MRDQLRFGQIQYYNLWELVAGQKLIIDVDTEKIDSMLDSYLEVFDSAVEIGSRFQQ